MRTITILRADDEPVNRIVGVRCPAAKPVPATRSGTDREARRSTVRLARLG
jgi:hypothetical protein